jgi:predicted ester cyclase
MAAKESNIKKQSISATNAIANAAVILQADRKLLDLVNKNDGPELNGISINEQISFNENEFSENEDNKIVKRKSKKFQLTATRVSPQE